MTNEERWLRTGREAHAMHWANASCVEARGVQTAHCLRHFVARVQREGVREGLPLLNFQCADKSIFGLSTTGRLGKVYPAAKGGLARRTGVAESDSACDHGLFTNFVEEVERQAREKAALLSNLTHLHR